MPDDLLRNGDFEEDWSTESSHRVRVFPETGAPYFTDVGNVFTPPGWTVFHKHTPVWAQPEVRDSRAVDPVKRFRSGTKGTLLFTFGKQHSAGLYQTVTGLTPGTKLRLTAWAHAWSNHKEGTAATANFPHPDDPKWSEGAGYGPYAEIEPEGPYANTGDVQVDARHNFIFRISVDPHGGENPYAPGLILGEKWNIYNEFHQLSVEFEAQSESATVFLASLTRFPFKHNDAYWDDAVLEVIEEPPPPPPLPPVDLGCIKLREPIDLVTFLVSPRESTRDVVERMHPVWDVFRWSVTGSADHASTSCGAKSHTVLASNPADWGQSPTLSEFMAEKYPDVDLIPFSHDTDFRLTGRSAAAGLLAAGIRLAYPSTHQPPYVTSDFGNARDYGPHEGLDLRGGPTWGDKNLAAIGGTVTVAGWNVSEPWYGYQVRSSTPVLGGYQLLVRYAHMVEGSIRVKVGDVVSVGQVLGAVGATGKNADGTPSCTGTHTHVDARLMGPVIPSSLKLYCDPELLIFHVDEEPQQPPLPPTLDVPNAIGLHLQSEQEGYLAYVEKWQPPWSKLVHNAEASQRIKAASKGKTMVVYRNHPSVEDYVNFDKPFDVAKAVADEMARTWPAVEANLEWIDAVEGSNEQVGTAVPDKLLRVTAFESALSDEIKRRCDTLGKHVMLFSPNIPPGNPGHGEWPYLDELARTLLKNDHRFTWHGYFPATTTVPSLTEKWLAEEGFHHHLRILSGIRSFQERGITGLKVVSTEGGAIGTYVREDKRPGGYISAGNGWKDPLTLNGDLDRYVKLLVQLEGMLKQIPGFEGYLVFTTAAKWIGWEHFEFNKAEMEAFSAAMEARG